MLSFLTFYRNTSFPIKKLNLTNVNDQFITWTATILFPACILSLYGRNAQGVRNLPSRKELTPNIPLEKE